MHILLIAYDNDSYMHHFPQGLAYIAAVLVREGYAVEIYNQDKFHYCEEHLTSYLDRNKFDVVGVGVIAGYYQYRKLLKISQAIKKSKNKPFYILGGHGPSPDPKFFIEKTGADAVVIGEGEETIVDLIRALANNQPLAKVNGIAFCDGKEIVNIPRRPIIMDVDSIPFPAYDLFPMDYYRLFRAPRALSSDFVMPVLSGRGCKFKCNFCYRMDKGIRIRKNESIIEEILFLQKNYGITYIIFSDELLMSSSDRTIALAEDIIRNKLNIRWYCNGRLNYAKPEVLTIMKRAGCLFINYGIEAMDDEVLKNAQKGLTVDCIIKGIENTLNAGISPGYNIIFGNIGDSKKTLDRAVRFLLKYDDCKQMRTIRPVTPYPGSPLYYYAIKKGLLRDCEDFYEHKHINSDLLSVNFTKLSDEEFHKELEMANEILIRNYYQKKTEETLEKARRLYQEKDKTFRGFR